MSEEEKKAIETTKLILKEWQKIIDIKDDIERDIEMSMYSEEMPFYEMKILLNLIEKQQKEIEELKQENKDHLEALTEWVNGERINDIKHISKDKVKDLIKEIEEEHNNIMSNKEKCLTTKNIHSYQYNAMITVLEELLEE